MAEPSISDIVHALKAEHLRSLEKHGDWSGYTVDEMVAATMAEVREFLTAHTLGDTSGPHGMLIEGLQAMNCFAKTLMELSRREICQGVETR